MILLIGLGNPENEYKNTRHNVGKMFIEYYDEHAQGQKIKAIKLNSYMNESGPEVSKLVNFYSVDLTNVYVVHDDLDIAFGSYKIQLGKGPKVHNGILSIEQALGSVAFNRIRIGVENREAENKMQGSAYVLAKFTKDELLGLTGVFEEIYEELTAIIQVSDKS